jgi:hypothetical protein
MTACFGMAVSHMAVSHMVLHSAVSRLDPQSLEAQSLTWIGHAHINRASLEDLYGLETGMFASGQHA